MGYLCHLKTKPARYIRKGEMRMTDLSWCKEEGTTEHELCLDLGLNYIPT